ncbi:MAG TPA: hypothetical protein VNR18_04665 [Hyphomicrobiales bacterium]|nr:hypothetical protein [Hyphomicrobiales bacterium]
MPMLCAMYVAPVSACPDDAVLAKIAGFKNLFIGEVHGTVETPEFVRCVIDKKIELQGSGLVVSLELPRSVETSSEFWNRSAEMQDGRASQAMHELFLYLQSKEQQGVIALRFLDTGVGSSNKELMSEQEGFPADPGVVIYRGNAHSKKSVYEGTPFLLGAATSEFVHISVIAGDGGEFWGCAPGCGVHAFPAALGAEGKAIPHGALIDGKEHDHDYIYFLESRVFTASLPWKDAVVCEACVGEFPGIPRF